MHKVLIVDDSFVMRTLIKEILTPDARFQIVGNASNGIEALEMVSKHSPDLIMLDIEMPQMDGIEFMRKLQTSSSLAKVVIVSSVAQTASLKAMEAKRLGAVDIVAKPSGGMSLDLKIKKGDVILAAAKKACGIS